MPTRATHDSPGRWRMIMRTDWFRQVHAEERQCRLWRSLLVSRRTVLNEMRTIENVVRASLREGDSKLGTPSARGLPEGCANSLAKAGGETAGRAARRDLARCWSSSRTTKRVLDMPAPKRSAGRLEERTGRRPITALAFRATADRHALTIEPGTSPPSRSSRRRLPVRRDRHPGRICRCGDDSPACVSMRSPFAARAQQEMVEPARLGIGVARRCHGAGAGAQASRSSAPRRATPPSFASDKLGASTSPAPPPANASAA